MHMCKAKPYYLAVVEQEVLLDPQSQDPSWKSSLEDSLKEERETKILNPHSQILSGNHFT